MMIFIIRLVFAGILLLFANQIYKVNIALGNKRASQELVEEHVHTGDFGKYADIGDLDAINAVGNKIMHAVVNGIVKKHLLHNDAPEYNSEVTTKQYLKFINESSLYDRINNMEEIRYNG